MGAARRVFLRQHVVGSAAGAFFAQQPLVAQPAQHLAGRQGVQPAKVPARRVVYGAGFSGVEQRLGFVGANALPRKAAQPGVLLVCEQVVQEERDFEFVGLTVGVDFRQRQAGVCGQAAHGTNPGAFGFGKMQVMQHRCNDGVAQVRAGRPKP